MNINHNNRLSIAVPVGVLDASEVLPLLYAHKKMRVLAASYIQEGAISVDAVNYIQLQLKKNDVAFGLAVDSQDGLAARTPLHMDFDTNSYLELALGDYLSLDVVEGGAFVEGTDGLLVLDVEVVGN